jgi:hypothetical protein
MGKKNNNFNRDAGLSAAETAKFLERQQVSKYHTKDGHEFVAKKVNDFYDKVRFKKIKLAF